VRRMEWDGLHLCGSKAEHGDYGFYRAIGQTLTYLSLQVKGLIDAEELTSSMLHRQSNLLLLH